MESMFANLHTWGYLILFLYSLGGGFLALAAAGVLSSAGELNIVLCIVIACISNFIGDSGLFLLSRYNKKEIMPYLRKQRRNLALAQILFRKYGDRIILIKKFIYGVKTLVPIALGLTEYSFYKFSVINLISSVLWAVIVGLASYKAGDYFMSVSNYLGEHGYIMPLAMVGLLLGIWLFLQHITKRRKA